MPIDSFWTDSYKEWEMRRMAVYAAQVDRLDQNIGKIMAKLEHLGIADNTLIFFMSDNGGNYEEFAVPSASVAASAANDRMFHGKPMTMAIGQM